MTRDHLANESGVNIQFLGQQFVASENFCSPLYWMEFDHAGESVLNEFCLNLALANNSRQAFVNSLLLNTSQNCYMDIQEIRRLNLRRLMNASNFDSDSAFCKEYGLDPSYISQILNHHRGYGEKAARAHERKIGLKEGTLDRAINAVEEAKNGYNVSDRIEIPFKSISLRASSDPSDGFEVQYDDDETIKPMFYRRDWIAARGYRPERLICRQINGSSMEPALYHGDKVLINLDSVTPKHNRVFEVIVEGQALAKRLLKRGSEWWITSDNENYSKSDLPLENEQQIIGQIVQRDTEII